MRILVTGGAGFIGSHTVELLLAAGHRVRVLDNLSSGDRGQLPREAEWQLGDVRDEEAVANAVEGMDAVLHLAAIVSVPRSIAEPLESHAVNATGGLQVMEHARAAGVRRLVFASSAAVYGAPVTMPVAEEAPLAPMAPYGSHKRYNEECARLAWGLHGFETVGLRYFNVFGPRQDPSSPYSGVLSIFIDRAIAGLPATLHGDGGQTRDFVAVEDVARANLAALTTPGVGGRVYNVGTGTAIRVAQAHATIARATGTELAPHLEPAREGDIRDSCARIDRIRLELGWEATVPFEEGIARTVAWRRTTR